MLVGSGPSLKHVSQEMLDRHSCITMAINQQPWMAGLWTDHVVFIDGVRMLNGHPQKQHLYDGMVEVLQNEGITKWTRRVFNNRGEPAINAGRNMRYFVPYYNLPPEEYFRYKDVYCGDLQREEKHEGYDFENTFFTSGLFHLYHVSSILPAFRIMYEMGCRRIYLLGTDFRPLQDRFIFINDRLTGLQPVFLAHGLEVLNCTRDSGLTAFPFEEFPAATEPEPCLMSV